MTTAEITFPCFLPERAFTAPGGTPTIITVTVPVVDASRCTFACENTGAVAVNAVTMAFKVDPDDVAWGVESSVPAFVLAPAGTGAKTFEARVAAVRFTFAMAAPGGEVTLSGRGGPASAMEDAPAGAELPDTPLAVLLDATNPSTIVGLNASGEGEALSASAARTRIGAAEAEADPGMPTLGIAAHWRALDLSALVPGDPVDLWEPATGGGDLVAAGAARPTYLSTGSPTGAEAVEFDGSANGMAWADPAGIPSGFETGTIVAVVWRSKPPAGAYGHVLQYGTTAADQARGLAMRDAGWWTTHEWVDSVTTSPLAWASTPTVLGHVYTSALEVQLWVNGAPRAWLTVALNTAVGAGTSFNVGMRLGSGQFGAFRVMEIAVYDHALTDAEWRQVMAHARIAHGVYA